MDLLAYLATQAVIEAMIFLHSRNLPSWPEISRIRLENANTFQKRAASSLLSSRAAVLPTAAETPGSDGDDLELVTWLVIQEGK